MIAMNLVTIMIFSTLELNSITFQTIWVQGLGVFIISSWEGLVEPTPALGNHKKEPSLGRVNNCIKLNKFFLKFERGV